MAFDTSIRDAAIRARQQRLEAERRTLLDRARARLLEIRGRYGVREAHVLGSLAREGGWRRDSDVDVAVSGCSPAILDVMKELEEATGRDVDVIDLDRHPAPAACTRRSLQIYG